MVGVKFLGKFKGEGALGDGCKVIYKRIQIDRPFKARMVPSLKI